MSTIRGPSSITISPQGMYQTLQSWAHSLFETIAHLFHTLTANRFREASLEGRVSEPERGQSLIQKIINLFRTQVAEPLEPPVPDAMTTEEPSGANKQEMEFFHLGGPAIKIEAKMGAEQITQKIDALIEKFYEANPSLRNLFTGQSMSYFAYARLASSLDIKKIIGEVFELFDEFVGYIDIMPNGEGGNAAAILNITSARQIAPIDLETFTHQFTDHLNVLKSVKEIQSQSNAGSSPMGKYCAILPSIIANLWGLMAYVALLEESAKNKTPEGAAVLASYNKYLQHKMESERQEVKEALELYRSLPEELRSKESLERRLASKV